MATEPNLPAPDFVGGNRGRSNCDMSGRWHERVTRTFLDPLFRAAIVLGVGLGGFIDGIVLHQVLGWHHLICTTSTCQPDHQILGIHHVRPESLHWIWDDLLFLGLAIALIVFGCWQAVREDAHQLRDTQRS
ncbi:MAG: DUF2243 domain-containing protein [Opitutus sp.]